MQKYQADGEKIAVENRWRPEVSNSLSKTLFNEIHKPNASIKDKITKSTLHSALKLGDIVRRTISMKPLLTNENNYDRMILALPFIIGKPHEKNLFLTR